MGSHVPHGSFLQLAGKNCKNSAANVTVVCTGSLITGRGLLDVTCHTKVSPLVIGEVGRRMRESLTVWDERGNIRGLPIPVCSLLMSSLVLLLKMAR